MALDPEMSSLRPIQPCEQPARVGRLITLLLLLPLTLALASLVAGCSEDPGDQTGGTAMEHAAKHLDPKYVCPMHPQIMRDEPGTCPLCGMALVKKQLETPTSSPTVELPRATIQKLGVRTAKVTKGDLWKYIRTVGYVRYNEKTLKTVRSPTAGWVENLAVRRAGLPVSRGQLLLELYSPEFLAVQKQFLAAHEKDRADQMKKYGAREESVPARDHLRYLEVPESLVNEIGRKGQARHRLPIYAPLLGTLVRHYIHKHMYVTPGQPLFTIADLSTVWVETDVFEHQLTWVRRGQEAEIEVQSLPGERFSGQVNYIYPELDPDNRTLKVRLQIPNPNGLLMPNMSAQVHIYGGPLKDALQVPREAVIITGERESVILALGDGRFQPREITTGMRSRGQVEILSGLEEGDEVVTSGQFLIDSEANLQASFQRLDGAAE